MRFGCSRPKLYFVKVDLKACFDSIEQGKLLEILASIVSHVTAFLPIYGDTSSL